MSDEAPRRVEFSGLLIEQRNGDSLVVSGRNGESPLAVGDTFTTAYRDAAMLYGESEPRLVEPRPVNLTVTDLRAYGRTVQRIARRLPASVHLSGTGAELLERGDVLVGGAPAIEQETRADLPPLAAAPLPRIPDAPPRLRPLPPAVGLPTAAAGPDSPEPFSPGAPGSYVPEAGAPEQAWLRRNRRRLAIAGSILVVLLVGVLAWDPVEERVARRLGVTAAPTPAAVAAKPGASGPSSKPVTSPAPVPGAASGIPSAQAVPKAVSPGQSVPQAAGSAQAIPVNTVVTPDQAGETLTVRVGETFRIRLADDARWRVAGFDERILRIEASIPTPGGGDPVFRALAPGQTPISGAGLPTCLTESTPCTEPARTFTLNVTVQ